jgi:putative holliday junction resolvase
VTASPQRFLGIDYGTRRIGLAHGDNIGVATPLPALASPDEAKRWDGLAAMLKERRITDVVLGLPLNMDGSSGPKALEVEEFARRIRAEFKLPVHLVDERLTSYEAESTIPPSKRRAVRKSGLIDSRAATIILQDFLDDRFPSEAPQDAEP